MADETMAMDDGGATATPEVPTVGEATISSSDVAKRFKARADAAKKNVQDFHNDWKLNVDARLGKTGNGGQWTAGYGIPDNLQSTVNPDWSLTKTKTANLFSQVPTVQMTHENKQYAPAIPPFAKAVNFELGEKRANVGVAMEEALNDVVNAAGVGFVVVDYVARFDEIEVPTVDLATVPPEIASQLLASGQIPMAKVPRAVSERFMVTRGSPKDLLWPAEFVGSNFDDGDWIGHRWKKTWAVAKTEFKLSDQVKEKVIGAADARTDNELKQQPDRVSPSQTEAQNVSGVTLFYWRARVDPDEKQLGAIWKLVFVDGMEEPVVHEPWKGQQLTEDGLGYVGSCKFPVRVLTLTYITDNPVPPSDSQAGRPQVLDLRRSRSQMFANRARSIPVRGYDTNRIDPMIMDLLSRGEFQGWIPVNGNAERAIWEVARASYPAEDLSFDQSTKRDLDDVWMIGDNQKSQSTDSTAKEAEIVQSNFATRIGQERARVASFFLSAVEVLAGLMALYSDFPVLSDAERDQMLKAWDPKTTPIELVFKIRPDSTIMIEAKQRRNDLLQVLNMVAKSGFVNPMPIIVEILELSGLDPAEVMKQPEPPKPEEPKMSFSFAGKDDMVNPIVVALLMKNGMAPSPQDIAAAKAMLAEAQAPTAAPVAPPPPPQQGPPPVPDQPATPPGAHENWNLTPKVAARSRDMNPGG